MWMVTSSETLNGSLVRQNGKPLHQEWWFGCYPEQTHQLKNTYFQAFYQCYWSQDTATSTSTVASNHTAQELIRWHSERLVQRQSAIFTQSFKALEANLQRAASDASKANADSALRLEARCASVGDAIKQKCDRITARQELIEEVAHSNYKKQVTWATQFVFACSYAALGPTRGLY